LIRVKKRPPAMSIIDDAFSARNKLLALLKPSGLWNPVVLAFTTVV
jgi:hypothetical protein